MTTKIGEARPPRRRWATFLLFEIGKAISGARVGIVKLILTPDSIHCKHAWCLGCSKFECNCYPDKISKSLSLHTPEWLKAICCKQLWGLQIKRGLASLHIFRLSNDGEDAAYSYCVNGDRETLGHVSWGVNQSSLLSWFLDRVSGRSRKYIISFPGALFRKSDQVWGRQKASEWSALMN
jgi:hypothetical protein